MKDQAWFWTEEWQEGEREVELQIKNGHVSEPMNLDDTLEELSELAKAQ